MVRRAGREVLLQGLLDAERHLECAVQGLMPSQAVALLTWEEAPRLPEVTGVFVKLPEQIHFLLVGDK